MLDLSALDPEDARRPTIADVPGLIEGASGGAGLGHAFLRHVERTRVLVHVVDLAARDPEGDRAIVREELRLHDDGCSPSPGSSSRTSSTCPGRGTGSRRSGGLRPGWRCVLGVSAREGEGLLEFTAAIAKLLPGSDELSLPPEPAGIVVHRFDSERETFAVEREADGFRVRGRRIERLVAQTDFENEESAERFQRDLERMGVERELRRAGVQPGDSVAIGGRELEWGDEGWA